MVELVEIERSRLDELERYERKLFALMSAGVDNWEWYDDALEGFDADD